MRSFLNFLLVAAILVLGMGAGVASGCSSGDALDHAATGENVQGQM